MMTDLVIGGILCKHSLIRDSQTQPQRPHTHYSVVQIVVIFRADTQTQTDHATVSAAVGCIYAVH